MSVIDLDSRRKKKKATLSELCDMFIAKADPVISAQMDSAGNACWGMILVDVFLSVASNVADALSNPEMAEKYKMQRAERMAEFMWKGEYPDTIFQLILSEDHRGSAQDARDKGLYNLARALEVEPI